MEYMEYIKLAVTAIIILIIFYFATYPRKSQEKHTKKMQEELKVGDKVVTYTGLSGQIEEVLEDRVILNTNPDHIRLSIEKWAIAGLDDRSIEKSKEN